jgi:hypothetical protein
MIIPKFSSQIPTNLEEGVPKIQIVKPHEQVTGEMN